MQVLKEKIFFFIISKSLSVPDIIEKIEREKKKTFLDENGLKVEDMLRRVLAVAQSAKLMDFKEAADIVFKIKFGLNMGLITGITNEECNSMIFKSQMGHLTFLLLNSHAGKFVDRKSVV